MRDRENWSTNGIYKESLSFWQRSFLRGKNPSRDARASRNLPLFPRLLAHDPATRSILLRYIAAPQRYPISG